jgi:hypothetical protein
MAIRRGRHFIKRRVERKQCTTKCIIHGDDKEGIFFYFFAAPRLIHKRYQPLSKTDFPPRQMRIITLLIIILTAVSCRTSDLAIVKLDDKFGCIDRSGNFVIKPTWDWMLDGDKQILVEKDSLYGFIDKKGNIVIPTIYNDANSFYEGLAAVSNGKKFGFINVKGDTVIPFAYNDVFLGFSNGLSDVTKNDSCGYIDKKGKLAIPFVYETCYPFLSKYATIETFDGRTMLVNKRGQLIAYNKDKHKNLRLWSLNTYPGSFETRSGRGRVNEKRDTIVPPLYSSTGNFIEGRSIVELKSQWGVYDDKGNLIVKPQYEDLSHFSEGLAAFKLNGKWGFIDKQGKEIIKPIYDDVGQFSKGLAYIELNGLAGFIDKKGKMVIEPRFQLNRWSKFE